VTSTWVAFRPPRGFGVNIAIEQRCAHPEANVSPVGNEQRRLACDSRVRCFRRGAGASGSADSCEDSVRFGGYLVTVPENQAESRPATSRRPRQRNVALGVVAILGVTVVVAVAWHPWSRGQPLRRAGPIDGAYSAEFGPEIELGSEKVLNPTPARGTFEVASTCTSAGCIAVAKATSGPTIKRHLILDNFGGRWQSVDTAPSASSAVSAGLRAGCEQGLSPEVWETLLLQPRPDGKLVGQYEVTDANNCNTSRTVNFIKTGAVNATNMDNPAAVPTRKSSPAIGFRGRYRYTHIVGSSLYDVEGTVQTHCLRSGKRCMSYFYEPESSEPFVFADGRWNLHYYAPVDCATADLRVRIDRAAELVLPQPSDDPIDVLVGDGQEQVLDGGPCSVQSKFQLRFDRIGD
jgi:hypothetical protein